MVTRKIILFSVFLCCHSPLVYCQILHTESFSVILDTTKNVKGSIIPNFKFQNLKENLIEFENIADISIRIKDNAITFANKIEVSKFGNEILVSGGYVYGEFRKIYEKTIAFEVYGQVHWAEARGMERKYAGGINARWRIISKETIGLFAGVGPFYEFERWNFEGISDTSLIPENAAPREISNLKLGSYLSFKYALFKKIFVDGSIYHQSRFDEIFTTPRLASSTRVTYSFTEFLGLSLICQNIYDPRPVVPIDKLFNKIIFGVSISF